MPDTGLVAMVFVVWSLLATDWNAPLAPGAAEPGYAVSVAQTYEDQAAGSVELRAIWLTGRRIGAAQIVLDASLTDRGGLWAGIGGRMASDFDLGPVPGFASASAGLGLWHRGDDVDLGFPLNFRADVEIGVRTGAGRIGLVWDHRSHGYLADLFEDEPPNGGLESLSIRYTRKF